MYLRDIDHFVLKYTGRGMTSTEIYDSLKKIIENNAAQEGDSKSWCLSLLTIKLMYIMIGVLVVVILASSTRYKWHLAEMGIERDKATIFSGIGCSGKTSHFINTYGVHTLAWSESLPLHRVASLLILR